VKILLDHRKIRSPEQIVNNSGLNFPITYPKQVINFLKSRVAIDGKQDMCRLDFLKIKPELLWEVTPFVNSKATYFSGICFTHVNFVLNTIISADIQVSSPCLF